MNSEIIIAGLALVGTIFGSLISNLSMSKVLKYRINIIEEKMNDLAQLLERMTKAETEIDYINSYVHDKNE